MTGSAFIRAPKTKPSTTFAMPGKINRAKQYVLNLIQNDFTCAEIGVWKGALSKRIIQMNPAHLYLIDPWRFAPEYPHRWYGGKLAKSELEMESIFQSVQHEFSGHKNVSIIREKSETAIPKLPSLHWSYIDANHSFEFVLEDLCQCYSKTAPGGYICGDDHQKPGVKRALSRFLRETRPRKHEIVANQFIIIK